MSGEVSFLKPVASNPATSPLLTDALVESVNSKASWVLNLLKDATAEFKSAELGNITFANSFGAEDMVLTDIILRNQLPIEIFSLDTGRLPTETYDLIALVEQIYNTK